MTYVFVMGFCCIVDLDPNKVHKYCLIWWNVHIVCTRWRKFCFDCSMVSILYTQSKKFRYKGETTSRIPHRALESNTRWIKCGLPGSTHTSCGLNDEFRFDCISIIHVREKGNSHGRIHSQSRIWIQCNLLSWAVRKLGTFQGTNVDILHCMNMSYVGHLHKLTNFWLHNWCPT